MKPSRRSASIDRPRMKSEKNASGPEPGGTIRGTPLTMPSTGGPFDRRRPPIRFPRSRNDARNATGDRRASEDIGRNRHYLLARTAP